jgi:hypothetical protein
MTCQGIKCVDYLTDGEPAWCYQAGQPAEVAALKCPRLAGEEKQPLSPTEKKTETGSNS